MTGYDLLRRVKAHGKEACRTAKASLRTAKTRRTAKVLCRTAKGCARKRVRISTWSGRSLTHKRISHPHPPSRHPPLSLDAAAPYPAAASLLSRSTPPRPTPPPPPSSLARRRRALPRRRLPPLSHVAAAAGPPTQTLPLASPSLAAASLLPPRQAAPHRCRLPAPLRRCLRLLPARRCCCLPAAARGAACPLRPPPAVGAAAATIRGSSGHHQPPVAPTGRPRRKNATRILTPSPSPPPAADDDDEEEDQEHHGGEDQGGGGGGTGRRTRGPLGDERLGNLVFDPDPSLEWHEPEDYQYVPAVERLRPRDRKPYRLPALKHWRYRHVVLQPYGRSSFQYEDPSQRPPRGYSNILGGLLRWYFPGIVNLPTGGCDVAWRWAHYSLAEDPLGRGTAVDLKYFKRAEGKENACDDVLHQLARKRVTGMHYEARVQCVRDWHADRFVHMTKEDARDTLMQPWQYLQNPPQYVGNDDRCFRAMVMWWTCPQYLKKHEEGKKKRAEMRGGSHIQGSIPISLHLQKEEVKTGAKPNVFAVLKKMKQRKTPDPETGSVWVNPQSETQCTSYVSKFKQKYGEDANPEAEDFDPEVAVLAGEGLKHGRLWFGDGCVDPAKVPSLRQIRRGRGDGRKGAGGPGARTELGAAGSGVSAAAGTDDAADATAAADDAAASGTDELADEPDGSVFSTGEYSCSPPYSMPWMPPPPTQTPGTPITVNNMNIIRSMNHDYVSQGNDDEAGASNGGGQG
ncbi:hypothetical protein QYE76_026349 [Lolium multiflorum]|uniref:Uncharacterized protein n=1 Tax=Lolium multiflorum TaxID=4521 RepID=A0AAD8RIF2_LOLMU|nr:hypothetical protein QYE76_026349 [Lolium multiflorum]